MAADTTTATGRRARRRIAGLVGSAVLGGAIAIGAPVLALAEPAPPEPAPVSVTAPTAQAVVGTDVAVPGASVAGFAPSDTVRVQISVSSGTVWLPATVTGVTVPAGYPQLGVPWPVLSVEGPQDALNAALARLRWTSSQPGPATVTVDATLGGATYEPATGHHYLVVAAPDITWNEARTAAEALTFNGLTGYLATITSAAEQELMGRTLDGPAWMGATDRDAEGEWTWLTGPEAPLRFWQPACGLGPQSDCVGVGYANWAEAQPDDGGGGADFGVFDTPAGSGWWSDQPGGSGASPSAYLVEFGAPDDVPASTGNAAGQLTAITVPGVPTDVVAEAGEGTAVVAWTPPADEGWTPVVGYAVTGSPGGTCSAVAPETSCAITGLTPGAAYTFEVTARNVVGAGPASARSGAVVPAAGPERVSIFVPVVVPQGEEVEEAPDGVWAGDDTDTGTGIDFGAGSSVGEDGTFGDAVALGEGTAADGASLHLVFDVGVGAGIGATRLTLRGAGLQPGAPTTVTVHSTPRLLDSIEPDAAGTFEREVLLPADLDDGEHVLVVRGKEPAGQDRYRVMAFAVEDGKLARIGVRHTAAGAQVDEHLSAGPAGHASDAVGAEPEVQAGGSSKLPLILLVLLVLGGAGVALVLLHRRRQPGGAGTARPGGPAHSGSSAPTSSPPMSLPVSPMSK